MFSSQHTIEQAIEDFRFMRNHAPFRFGGKWFIAKTLEGFEAFRTKKAAMKHSTIETVWKIEFGKEGGK